MPFRVRHLSVLHLRTIAELVRFQHSISKDVLDGSAIGHEKVTGQLAVAIVE